MSFIVFVGFFFFHISIHLNINDLVGTRRHILPDRIFLFKCLAIVHLSYLPQTCPDCMEIKHAILCSSTINVD